MKDEIKYIEDANNEFIKLTNEPTTLKTVVIAMSKIMVVLNALASMLAEQNVNLLEIEMKRNCEN